MIYNYIGVTTSFFVDTASKSYSPKAPELVLSFINLNTRGVQVKEDNLGYKWNDFKIYPTFRIFIHDLHFTCSFNAQLGPGITLPP